MLLFWSCFMKSLKSFALQIPNSVFRSVCLKSLATAPNIFLGIVPDCLWFRHALNFRHPQVEHFNASKLQKHQNSRNIKTPETSRLQKHQTQVKALSCLPWFWDSNCLPCLWANFVQAFAQACKSEQCQVCCEDCKCVCCKACKMQKS